MADEAAELAAEPAREVAEPTTPPALEEPDEARDDAPDWADETAEETRDDAELKAPVPELRADEAEDLREASSDERELLAEPVAVDWAAERELRRELMSALSETRPEETEARADEALPVRVETAPAAPEVPALAMDEAPETASLPTDEAPEATTDPTEEAPEIP